MMKRRVLLVSIMAVLVFNSVALAGMQGIRDETSLWDGASGQIQRIEDRGDHNMIIFGTSTEQYFLKHRGPIEDYKIGQQVQYFNKHLEILRSN
jgi:hypothetical protein